MYEELVKRLRFKAGFESVYDSVYDEAADAIEELEQQNEQLAGALDRVSDMYDKLACELPKWIPVTERLPEIKEHHVSDDVIVYLSDGGLGFSALEENIFGQTWFECERINPDGESGYEVTHWMPLPEPPKEEA